MQTRPAMRLACSAALLLLASAAAAAQPTFAEEPLPEHLVSAFIDDAGLNDVERDLLLRFHRDYLSGMAALGETMQSARAWLYSHTTPLDDSIRAAEFIQGVWSESNRMERRWSVLCRELRLGLFSDLRDALPERTEDIDRFERADRRFVLLRADRLTRDGPYTGAAFDVIAFAEEHLRDHPENPSIKEILARWDVDVDRLLRRYEELRIAPPQTSRRTELMNELRAKVEAGEDATREVREIAEMMGELGYLLVQLFKVHETACLQIASLVEDEAIAGRFRAEPRRRLLAWMYETVPVESYLESALQRESLADEQRDALLGLRAEMNAARDAMEPGLETLHKRAMTEERYHEYYERLVRQQMGLEAGERRLNEDSVALYAGRDDLVARMNSILERARQVLGETAESSTPSGRRP